VAGKGRRLVLHPVFCAPRRPAFRRGCILRSDRIFKEGCNERNYLEPDSVGSCNRYSIVSGNEHTDQRTGTTTKPKTARYK
jgi:hypothetical protein